MVQKKILILLLSGLLIAATTPAYASVHVNGYFRKDGTYVQPHNRSNPDGNFYNNWSTKGNINPYTGQEGTKTHPEYSSGSGYDVPVQVPVTPPATEPTPAPYVTPPTQSNWDLKQYEEDLKKQQEQFNKEMKKQQEELKKQQVETDKMVNDALKQLNEIGDNYTPPADSNTYTNKDTQDTTATGSDQIATQDNNESKVDSAVHKKTVQSNQSWWQNFINFIKGLFSSTKVNSNENDQSVYYEDCTDARAQGAAPVYEGDPGYTPALDRDGDGVGCE